jgi:urease accessory protein
MPASSSAAALRGQTFAANRATGRIALSVAAAHGLSRRTRVHEAGSLRVRFPNSHGERALDAVIVNTAGGMTGGDRFELDFDVDAGARLSVTTAAAEKVYRSLGPDTNVGIKLTIGDGATLAWLPQETILFDQVRLRRIIDVELAGNAQLLLAEAIVFGRAAMGETVSFGHLFDRWRVRLDGALIFAETMRIDGGIAERLADRPTASGGAAIASILKIPGDEEAVAAVNTMRQNFHGEVGASAWNGLALVRLVARDGAALRHDLTAIVSAWSDAPLPRLWLN